MADVEASEIRIEREVSKPSHPVLVFAPDVKAVDFKWYENKNQL